MARWARGRGGAAPIAVAVALITAALLAALGGCGDTSSGGVTGTRAETGDRPAREHRQTARRHRETVHRHLRVAPETVSASRCPPGLPSCRARAGRILYVERVDPDGDGDAHFVILDPRGITLPGLTAIDVRKGLRPRPLPGVGDLISAAGPVQTGSYGQSQIHALELHVAGR
jgi:hypothetical protein